MDAGFSILPFSGSSNSWTRLSLITTIDGDQARIMIVSTSDFAQPIFDNLSKQILDLLIFYCLIQV